MPTPHIFRSRGELVDQLASQSTRHLASSFFSDRTDSIESVTLLGVGPNTYRAFRNLRPYRPSVLFRQWSTSYLHQTLGELEEIFEPNTFETYVHKATESLCCHWRTTTRVEIGYGRAAKLINLVLKKLACLNQLSNEFRETLIRLQHVPLDSYTLVGLKNIATEMRIPRNASMKYVETRSQYRQLQALVSRLSTEAGVPPIYYDILAWNMKHP